MADGQQRTRRSSRYEQTPDRVRQAARQMNGQQTPSGAAYDASRGQGYSGPQNGAWGGYGPYGQPYDQQGQQAYDQQQFLRQEYARQQEFARQQEYLRQQAAWQQNRQRQMERERINSETASHGAFRGYTGQTPVIGGPGGPAGGPPPQPGKGRRIGLTLAVIAMIAVLGAGGFFAVRSYLHTKEIHNAVSPYDNLFVQGVYVDGISLGGMTPEQGLNSVQSQIQQRNDAWNVTLTYQGVQLAQINAGMLGMSVDIGKVMNDAWAQGHVGDEETRYAAMEALKETPYQAYTATPSGDTSVIDSILQQVKNQIDTPAVDASLTGFDPGLSYPFTFQPESRGYRLDTEEIREELYHKVATLTSGTVELVPEVIEPSVRLEDLQKHYSLRASVSTPISTSSEEDRNNNIRRALECINGYVLPAGSQFSFNGVVGERTEENGFFPAIEYAYGEHVMGIGGGVCQASTTVYQAAVCAGLSIVKREPHSDAVNYTDYGKDATVYWVGKRKIDLVFRNNTENPIYMVAGVQRDPNNKRRLVAKVSIYGDDLEGIRYEMACKTVQEIDPPEKPTYVKDKDGTYVTYTDQEKSVSKAKPGYVVESYRVKYEGKTEIERVLLFTDTYQPKAERIYVGVTKRN